MMHKQCRRHSQKEQRYNSTIINFINQERHDKHTCEHHDGLGHNHPKLVHGYPKHVVYSRIDIPVREIQEAMGPAYGRFEKIIQYVRSPLRGRDAARKVKIKYVQVMQADTSEGAGRRLIVKLIGHLGHNGSKVQGSQHGYGRKNKERLFNAHYLYHLSL
jgi:hypothetical protein